MLLHVYICTLESVVLLHWFQSTYYFICSPGLKVLSSIFVQNSRWGTFINFRPKVQVRYVYHFSSKSPGDVRSSISVQKSRWCMFINIRQKSRWGMFINICSSHHHCHLCTTVFHILIFSPLSSDQFVPNFTEMLLTWSATVYMKFASMGNSLQRQLFFLIGWNLNFLLRNDIYNGIVTWKECSLYSFFPTQTWNF